MKRYFLRSLMDGVTRSTSLHQVSISFIGNWVIPCQINKSHNLTLSDFFEIKCACSVDRQ